MGTFWYHAHHHGATTLQVSGGMMGMIVIDDSNDNIPAPVCNGRKTASDGKDRSNCCWTGGGDQLISGTMSGVRWTVNGKIGGQSVCHNFSAWRVLLPSDGDASRCKLRTRMYVMVLSRMGFGERFP